MIVFNVKSNKRVINRRDNNNMYSNQENNITREHKRNIIILSGALCIIGDDMSNIKHHMIKLNK